MQTRIPWTILATVSICLLGCGAEPEQNQHTANPSDIAVSVPANTIANELEGRSEADAADGDGAATDPHGLLGKKCYADCSVVNTGAPSCPSRINGFGETTFLGGCAKACRKARGDAASKLPTGCSLGNCSTTGC